MEVSDISGALIVVNLISFVSPQIKQLFALAKINVFKILTSYIHLKLLKMHTFT